MNKKKCAGWPKPCVGPMPENDTLCEDCRKKLDAHHELEADAIETAARRAEDCPRCGGDPDGVCRHQEV